jgi:hypothetical protein
MKTISTKLFVGILLVALLVGAATVHTTSTNNSNIAITNPIQHFWFAFHYYGGLTPNITAE